jgi:hypothetical protein
MCVKSRREMQCNDPQKQRYCFYFTYTISTVVLRAGSLDHQATYMKRLQLSYYSFACSIVTCRSALQNLKRAQISSFCVYVFLRLSNGWRKTNSKFFRFRRIVANRLQDTPGMTSFPVLQCSGVHPKWYYRNPISDDCLCASASPVVRPFFSFYNAVTTAEDIYHVPGSNFVPDAGCLNLGVSWVSSVLPANFEI